MGVLSTMREPGTLFDCQEWGVSNALAVALSQFSLSVSSSHLFLRHRCETFESALSHYHNAGLAKTVRNLFFLLTSTFISGALSFSLSVLLLIMWAILGQRSYQTLQLTSSISGQNLGHLIFLWMWCACTGLPCIGAIIGASDGAIAGAMAPGSQPSYARA